MVWLTSLLSYTTYTIWLRWERAGRGVAFPPLDPKAPVMVAKISVYLMFLGSGVAIDVAASDDVTQNSCLERSQFCIVYRSTGQLCPTLGAPAGARLDPDKREREIVMVQRRKFRL
jgi:hypothetical protein